MGERGGGVRGVETDRDRATETVRDRERDRDRDRQTDRADTALNKNREHVGYRRV